MLLSIEYPLKVILVFQVTSVSLGFILTLHLIAMEVCTCLSLLPSHVRS